VHVQPTQTARAPLPGDLLPTLCVPHLGSYVCHNPTLLCVTLICATDIHVPLPELDNDKPEKSTAHTVVGCACLVGLCVVLIPLSLLVCPIAFGGVKSHNSTGIGISTLALLALQGRLGNKQGGADT
jgi:hypothetical protein